jgi:hypothetical protein
LPVTFLEYLNKNSKAATASYVHQGNVITFRTHRELDAYVFALLNTAATNGKEISPDHWNLLKSFDR